MKIVLGLQISHVVESPGINRKIDQLGHIIRKLKYGALTYNNPCYPKLPYVFALVLTVSEITTFLEKIKKLAILANFEKL